MFGLNSKKFLQRNILRLKSRLKSPLSRKIIFWVFSGIVVIEGIILVPSVQYRERELLSQIKEVSSGKVAWILITYPQISGEQLIDRLQELQENNSFLKGGSVYYASGEIVGTFGNSPNISISEIDSYKPQRQGSFYDDVVWSGSQMETKYTIILRHDASSVLRGLIAYIGRIIGLVVIISAFMTIVIWIALEPIVLIPIFRLRWDLLAAGEAIFYDQRPPKFSSASLRREDELGDVISAFKQMFNQITEAIYQRKQAELALQKSLEREAAYSQALDQELEKGRLMQKAFLPHELLQKPGIEIAAFTSPARRVAGDFYDVFELPNNNIAFVIADVCGKGVSAALFMGLFRSLIRIFTARSYSSHESKVTAKSFLKTVQLTNDYIANNHGNEGMFATLFMGVLCLDSYQLSYINGGHEPILIINKNGKIKQSLEATGMAVGMLADVEFEIENIFLESGDILLGYTDGVTEARNSNKEFFSRETVLKIVENPFDSSQEIVDTIRHKVFVHTGDQEQSDDITILAVRRI
ncbi:MAG: PP2C family protein-serine/threonine phosphatase [Crocosphaera sp.]|nr:PP2C family protein-serine/threonine phosphatase [Crocosphaera sp.]